jgi:hypothetical protein
MSVDTQRFLTGGGFAGIAAMLLFLGEPVWSLLPAAAAVVILGSLLYEKLFPGI